MFSYVSLIVVEFLLYFVEAPLYGVRFVLVFLPRFILLLIYLFSIISTASKSKRILQKLGVRSGTDPGMNRCTENISHWGDHGHVIRSRQLIYTAGLSLRKDSIDLLF